MRLNGLTARFCAGMLLVVGLTAAARGDLLFSSYTGEAAATNNSYTLGTEFTVGAASLRVTQLGAYDSGGDGLGGALQVGLWRVSDQQLIASATVPAGGGATLVDDWRFVALGSPVTLTAGATYRLATHYGDDPLQVDGDPKDGSVTVFSGVTISAGSVVRSGAFAYPTNVQATNRFAANAVVEVPEPGVAGLVAAGGVALLLRRRWR